MERIIFERTSEAAKLPTRANPTDSGLDFYSPRDITIRAGSDALIPLDLKVQIPTGMDLVFKEKSGRATKNKLIVGACVTGDELIKTNLGFFSAFDLMDENFIKNNDLKILSYSKNKEYTYEDFSPFKKTGIKNCLEIEFDNGKKIKCSEDHKFLTKENRWIEAKDLNENVDLLEYDFFL